MHFYLIFFPFYYRLHQKSKFKFISTSGSEPRITGGAWKNRDPDFQIMILYTLKISDVDSIIKHQGDGLASGLLLAEVTTMFFLKVLKSVKCNLSTVNVLQFTYS